MIVGFCWIKQDLFGWWNRFGKVILNNCVCFIICKDDGWDVVKEYWDVGVLFKDGIIVRGICQMSEKYNWKELVFFLFDMEYI